MGTIAKGYVGSTPPETLYEDEMRTVLNAIIKKEKYPYSLNDELKILKIMDSIEHSDKMAKKIILN